MTLTEQLNRLAEWPKICWRENGVFVIGDYHFWDSPQHGFCARHIQATMGVTDRPALAWLRDALEQVIEARGWSYRQDWNKRKFADVQECNAWVYGGYRDESVPAEAANSAEALLAALIAALGEGEG